LFQLENKNDLPVAIIQNGTRSNEKVGIGTVDTILEVVKENELSNPAIIILGEVVKHRAAFVNIQAAYSETLIA
jgi:uroporphyrin-III C-methyltransferase